MSRISIPLLIIALLLGQGAHILHKYDYGFYAHKSVDLSYKSLKSSSRNDAIVGTEMLAVPALVGRTEFYACNNSVAKVMDVVHRSRYPPAVLPA
jgi:hypothetical protein